MVQACYPLHKRRSVLLYGTAVIATLGLAPYIAMAGTWSDDFDARGKSWRNVTYSEGDGTQGLTTYNDYTYNDAGNKTDETSWTYLSNPNIANPSQSLKISGVSVASLDEDDYTDVNLSIIEGLRHSKRLTFIAYRQKITQP